MEDLMHSPITLIVKTPNQRIEDQTIQCMTSWTVKHLKKHLSTVYPSKPLETHQKIIYSGKLLHDHLMLKDVLRQYGDQNAHTVHLVCAGRSEHTEPSQTTAAPPSSPDSIPSSPLPTEPSSDGLRHRTAHPYDAYQQMYGPMYQDNPMMAYAQMMWMQQAYAQQMAHYMQYYQPGVADPAVQAHVPGPQPVNAVNNRQQQQGEVRMNAQGGPMLDDEEEEGIERDWLDWVYTICRLSVLLSIVYFYSSLSRFFMVASFFFFVYLYHGGFFQVNRRRVAAPVQERAPEHIDEPVAPPVNQEQEANQVEEPTPVVSAAPATPPPPGPLTVGWSFFTTFFTSLIPDPRPMVNAN